MGMVPDTFSRGVLGRTYLGCYGKLAAVQYFVQFA
jgi:hypothetical protein